MSGNPKNRETGIPGGQVILDVIFSKFAGSTEKVDDDDFTSQGTLPIVEIYNPLGTLITTSANTGEPNPTRNNKGDYEYVREIELNDTISDQWKITWKLTINGNNKEFSELFNVVPPGDAEFGDAEFGDAEFGDIEFRIGFAFNNPDLTSTHHAEVATFDSNGDYVENKGFGLIITPDEMRYIVAFGNKLVSPEANQTYDNNMLQWYIDNAIAMVERDLDIDILPRVVRHEDPIDQDSAAVRQMAGGSLTGEGSITRTQGNRTPRKDIPPASQEPNRVREPGYPYRPQQARHYLYLKLRRRPLLDCLKAVMADPVQNTIIDLYSWRREFNEFEGRLQFFPNLTAIGNFPFIPTKLLQANYPFHDFPSAIYIDYRTGYLNAADVPIEFRSVLLWTAGILLLTDFGDGKAPGLASASANLNSISESFATTQSATNALFGARLAYYKDHLKRWMKLNKFKYQRNLIGML